MHSPVMDEVAILLGYVAILCFQLALIAAAVSFCVFCFRFARETKVFEESDSSTP